MTWMLSGTTHHSLMVTAKQLTMLIMIINLLWQQVYVDTGSSLRVGEEELEDGQ